MGLHRDNGKENGNYYVILGSILGFIAVVEKWKLLPCNRMFLGGWVSAQGLGVPGLGVSSYPK